MTFENFSFDEPQKEYKITITPNAQFKVLKEITNTLWSGGGTNIYGKVTARQTKKDGLYYTKKEIVDYAQKRLSPLGIELTNADVIAMIRSQLWMMNCDLMPCKFTSNFTQFIGYELIRQW